MTSEQALEALQRVARELGPQLRERVVFVGGAVRGLLVTEVGATARPTDDVDAIVGVATKAEYYELQRQLRALGFVEDPDASVVCRFRRGPSVLDLMPTRPEILGFSNRWYEYALESAASVQLGSDPTDSAPITIRVITAPCFVATKLESFLSRGGGDLYHSDMEDIVAIVDGRPSLFAELAAERPDLRRYVRENMADLLSKDLGAKIAGHLHGDHSSQARVPLVLATCRRIADTSSRASQEESGTLPEWALVWTLHVREGEPAEFYVNCWFRERQRHLEPFLRGNRAPIACGSLAEEARSATVALWSLARPTVEAHAEVNAERPYLRVTDHLARENPRAAIAAIKWQRELDIPGGRIPGPSAPVPLSTAGAAAVRTLDAEAEKLASERIREAVVAKRAWDFHE